MSLATVLVRRSRPSGSRPTKDARTRSATWRASRPARRSWTGPSRRRGRAGRDPFEMPRGPERSKVFRRRVRGSRPTHYSRENLPFEMPGVPEHSKVFRRRSRVASSDPARRDPRIYPRRRRGRPPPRPVSTACPRRLHGLPRHRRVRVRKGRGRPPRSVVAATGVPRAGDGRRDGDGLRGMRRLFNRPGRV